MSDETLNFIRKEPDRIDEILSGTGSFGLFARIDHLIELVIFGAKVEFAPMNTDLDNLIIKNNYGARAKASLSSLMESRARASLLVTGYIIEHWDKDASIETSALLSLFKMIDPDDSPISTVDCIFAICDEMLQSDYLMYEVLEILVHFGNAQNKRSKISCYIIELLNHTHHRMWTLEALAKMKNPDTKLVEKVTEMSNIKNYNEKRQLNDMPEHEKRMSPLILDQIDNNSEYYSDKELLQRIRKSNLKAQALAKNLLYAWG